MIQAKHQIPVLFFVLAAAMIGSALLAPYLQERMVAMDVYVHDTYYVVTHTFVFYVLSLFFGVCGIVYLISEKVARKVMSIQLGRVHFWLSLCSVVVFFYGSYSFRRVDPHDVASARAAMRPAFGLAAAGFLGFTSAQIIFAVNFIGSFFRKESGVGS